MVHCELLVATFLSRAQLTIILGGQSIHINEQQKKAKVAFSFDAYHSEGRKAPLMARNL